MTSQIKRCVDQIGERLPVTSATRPVRVLPHPHRQTMSLGRPVSTAGCGSDYCACWIPITPAPDAAVAGAADLVDQLAHLMYDEETDRANPPAWCTT